jgi:hypothetical protein
MWTLENAIFPSAPGKNLAPSSAACGRESRRERNEGAVVPNLEYGAFRRFPMRSEATPAAQARAPARQDVASELGVFVVGGVVGGGECTRTNREVRPHGGACPLGPHPEPLPRPPGCSSPDVVLRERGYARGGAAGKPPI